jgi:ATP-binding cassette subfamily B protein IrtA
MMEQKKENRITLLLQWAGEQKIWLLMIDVLTDEQMREI